LSILESSEGKKEKEKTGAILGLCRAEEKQRHIQVLAFKEFKRKVGK